MSKKGRTWGQRDHEIGYWKGDKFHPLTNFGMRLLKHVVTPNGLPTGNGFVVEVTVKTEDRSGAPVISQWVSTFASFPEDRETA